MGSVPDHSSRTIWRTVTNVAGGDPCSRIAGMYDPAAADADRHVVYMSIPGIKDKISRPGTGYTNLLSYTGLLTGGSRQTDSKLAEYRLGEARTVRTVCQTGTTVHIWISYKLQCIGGNRRTIAASNGTAGIVAAPSGRFI